MKIFVGTLFCGEEEFEESKRMVLSQKDVEIHHCVIKNLPEYEAHNALWNEWNSAKINFDIFVKIDADTILDNEFKLRDISKEFQKNDRLTGMQIPLHDYFTDSEILGLNCFSNKVIFNPARSRLHADHADTGHDIVYRNDAVTHLSPAGKHCSYPNPKQSFHYGFHRMKKNQRETICKVYKAWKKNGGDGRAFALYGAKIAAENFSMGHDYGDEDFEKSFMIAFENFSDPEYQSSLENFMKIIGA